MIQTFWNPMANLETSMSMVGIYCSQELGKKNIEYIVYSAIEYIVWLL